MTEPRGPLAGLKRQAHRAAELDPLGLDALFGRPDWPQVTVLPHLAKSSRTLPRNPIRSLAVLRDVHCLMCAHEVRFPGTVLGEYPWLERWLIELGQAAGAPPCGNNATYGWANPTDERCRTFTTDPRERVLYAGLGHGETRLDELLEALAEGRFADALAAWEPMVEAARSMHRHNVADFMGNVLAPWVSHAFVIGGREWRGPTAAQLPVVCLDQMLWGYGLPDPAYQEYAAYYMAEQPLARRALVAATVEALDGRPICTAAFDGAFGPQVFDPLEALLRRMYGFRRSHRELARASLPVRAKGDDSWGTGLFDPEMLDRLIRHTERVGIACEDRIRPPRPRSAWRRCCACGAPDRADGSTRCERCQDAIRVIARG